MLTSLRRASRRLAGSVEPRLAPCTCGSLLSGAVPDPRSSKSRLKGKEVVRGLQTRSISSSTAWTTQAAPSSSSATAARTPRPLAFDYDAVASLDDLQDALNSNSRVLLHHILNHLSQDARAAMPRTTFNDLFGILSSTDRATWTRLNVSRRWNAVKLLRKLAAERDWELKPEQVRRAFAAGVKWEEERHGRLARGETGDWNSPEREAQRRKYLDDLRLEVMDLDRSVKGGRRDLEMLTEYARVVLLRDGTPEAPLELYRQALAARPPPTTADYDASPFIPSRAASSFLPTLFHDDSRLALSHLTTMLEGHHLPTTEVLQQIMREQMPGPEDAYARAREILDSACSSGGRSSQKELDRLMEERLKAAEWEELVESQPMLAFLRWLSVERSPNEDSAAEEPSQDEWLLLALRLWDGVYAQGAWDQPKSRESLHALEQLVWLIVPSGKPETTNAKVSSLPSPSPALVEAINLALETLSTPVLVSHASRLLNAVTLHTHSPTLARHIYFTLRRLAPLHSVAPFQWHDNLRTLFISLVLSASSMEDSAFVLQLYLEWTAAGMTYPKGAWTPVWRALGQRSDIDEVARVIGDYEERQRDRISGTIVSHILIASASQPFYLRTLHLLDFLRNRTPQSSIRADRNDRHRVSLLAYNAILRRLAATYQDRRRDALAVFSNLVADGLTPHTDTWNALLAGQVFRPKFHIEDVDNAGAAYNALIRSGCEADEMTYTLLIFGFLRMARGREKRTVGLDSALKTFGKAIDEDKLVRGQQAAGLVRALGLQERWEEAKGVAESWWRGVVVVQEREGARFGRQKPDGSGRLWLAEMKEVEDAQRDLASMEDRSLQSDVRRIARAPEEVEQVSAELATEDDEEQASSPLAFALVDGKYS